MKVTYDFSYISFHRNICNPDIAVNNENKSHNRLLPKDGQEIYLYSKDW